MRARAAQKKLVRELTSEVNWLVLGLVIERPSYGSEIRNRFERKYGDVLSLGESHIYGVIDRLLKRGWIEVVERTEVGRQPKTRYQATALGTRTYDDRLVAELAEEQRRQELWVRQLGVYANNPHAALRVIARAEKEYLKTAGSGAPPSRSAGVESPGVLIDRLSRERRGLTKGGMLEWFQKARDGFEKLG